MQKIYFNCYFLTKVKFSGVERFAYEVLASIDKLVAELNLTLIYQFIAVVPSSCANQHLPQFTNITIRMKGFSNRYLFEQCSLPLIVKSNFLINLCNTAPVFKRNQVVVLHDALVFVYPQAYSSKFVYIMKFIEHANARLSKFLVTVSEFSKNEISRYTKRKISKITVIHCGAPHAITTNIEGNNILHENGITRHKYVLFVCSQSSAPHKNLQSLDVIKYIPGIQVVIVGYLHHFELLNYSQVKFIANVSDEMLHVLYTNALCFVSPSLYEGFGLTPLEAMVNKCPVILSEIQVFHEIYADAALYFNPHDCVELATKIKLIDANPNLRNTLIQKGLELSNQYSWYDSAKQLLDLCLR